MVLKEIQERYSTRSFLDKQIPDEVLKEILEAGRLALHGLTHSHGILLLLKTQETRRFCHRWLTDRNTLKMRPLLLYAAAIKMLGRKKFSGTLWKKEVSAERINILLNSSLYTLLC